METAAILWRRLDRPGHEAARLVEEVGRWRLVGTAVFLHEGAPCRLGYVVLCDPQGRTFLAGVSGWLGDQPVSVTLSRDEEAHWSLNDLACPELAGCLDVDLNFSPSTNLLTIRRLGLAVGEQAPVRAAWLRFPSFTVEPLDQVYHRTGDTSYRYQSAGGQFTADLSVSAAGFATTYPGFCQAEGEA